ncbi:pyridoxamine 5'-phosphate oxidase-domain-containing protein [Circinella umbellata]|nr:pyridoxamine 5'-phosphate oxidase-domain-containing protein [Circinella umbellata]
MSSASWKTFLASQLKINIEQQGLSSTYTSLATVRPDGTPANRTVVFRGFAGEDHSGETGWQSDLLTITSAKRSRKITDIATQPKIELNWFMAGTQEQFRIHGKCYVIEESNTDINLIDKELEEHITKKDINVETNNDKNNLATRAFLTRLKNNKKFDWENERLRQWYRMNDHLRGTFTSEPKSPLEINDMNNQGWFLNNDSKKQKLLEEGYKNFALLIIKVEFIDHVELISGTHSIFKKDDNNNWIFKQL